MKSRADKLRERYSTDEVYRQKVLARGQKDRDRWKNDPAYKARRNQLAKENYDRVKDDPKFKAKNRSKVQAWAKANPEACKRRDKLRWQNMSEAERKSDNEKRRLLRAKNRERVSAYSRDFRRRNPGYGQAYASKWWRENKDKAAMYAHAKRARRAAVESTLTAEEWSKMLAEATFCFYCRQKFTVGRRPTMDHMVPISKKGPHTKDNVVVACGTCNSAKGTLTSAEYQKRVGRAP